MYLEIIKQNKKFINLYVGMKESINIDRIERKDINYKIRDLILENASYLKKSVKRKRKVIEVAKIEVVSDIFTVEKKLNTNNTEEMVEFGFDTRRDRNIRY